MTAKTLSIVVPAFNEEKTVRAVLERLHALTLIEGVEKEIVVVDDCSTDRTGDEVRAFIAEHPGARIELTRHAQNAGKGAALHTGFAHASGDYVVVQDADLEYDPEELNLLLKPMLDDRADVVYGSRFMGGRPHRILFFWHTIGNRFLTLLSNAATDLNLTDMETCYKMVRRDILQRLNLEEKRFGFEPEITAKLARIPGIRIYEVGISYYGRTYAEGKKIGWKDGVRALYCIAKYNLVQR